MTVFSSPSFDHHERVVFKEDSSCGLRAIVAIHNTRLGAAMGGCRMYPYADEQQALEDVLRLSRGMTYKSALAGLPIGGGKAVIIGDPRRDKSRELLLAMGEFIDSFNGDYIIAEDSGTCVADMEVIAERTDYVTGLRAGDQHGGDPAPHTAQGVFCGICAALEYQFNSGQLAGRRIAVQGAGAIGSLLIEKLIGGGARVYVADVNAEHCRRAEALGATLVGVDEILSLEVDVLAPCAMGAVINDVTVESIRAPIVAGGANNQLADPRHGVRLRERGILYAPDFVINAGGILDVHYQRVGGSAVLREQRVENIAKVLLDIFSRADSEGRDTHSVAEQLAEAIFMDADNTRQDREKVG